MTPLRRYAKFIPALVLVALVLPSSAFGQATRTWVSGVGDDANPCSRTAPCKTFAGAISKTAAKGEINCLDPGGFGGVTITKSITIKCHYTEGGVLVSGTNAIVINAAATDKVTLRGLDINGLGTGLNGVRILSAKHVNIVDSEIYEFTGAGVDINPTVASGLKVVMWRNHIHDVGAGVMNAPGNNTVAFSSATLRDNDISDTTCGVVAGSFGQNGTTPSVNTTDCGTLTSASGINKAAPTAIFHSGLNLNGIGLFVRGASSTAFIAYDEITGNSPFGVHRVDTGHVKTYTPATNVIDNNTASDAPDQSTGLSKRAAKRLRKTGPGR
jgi:hypothetical protein